MITIDTNILWLIQNYYWVRHCKWWLLSYWYKNVMMMIYIVQHYYDHFYFWNRLIVALEWFECATFRITREPPRNCEIITKPWMQYKSNNESKTYIYFTDLYNFWIRFYFLKFRLVFAASALFHDQVLFFLYALSLNNKYILSNISHIWVQLVWKKLKIHFSNFQFHWLSWNIMASSKKSRELNYFSYFLKDLM